MSAVAVLCLSAIVGAFVLFAAVLAWGDRQTRDLTHAKAGGRREPSDTAVAVARLREAAADANEPIHAA